MTRKEYLELKGSKVPNTGKCVTPTPPYHDIHDYLRERQKMDEYQDSHHMDDELTEEDYRLFDENFEKIVEDLKYTDDDFPESELEKTVRAMKAVDWKWASPCRTKPGEYRTPTPEELLNEIRYCYEECLKDCRPRTGCSTGGITVKIDIFDHLVDVSFNFIDLCHYDKEFD